MRYRIWYLFSLPKRMRRGVKCGFTADSLDPYDFDELCRRLRRNVVNSVVGFKVETIVKDHSWMMSDKALSGLLANIREEIEEDEN